MYWYHSFASSKTRTTTAVIFLFFGISNIVPLFHSQKEGVPIFSVTAKDPQLWTSKYHSYTARRTHMQTLLYLIDVYNVPLVHSQMVGVLIFVGTSKDHSRGL